MEGYSQRTIQDNFESEILTYALRYQLLKVKMLVTQLCPALFNPMDGSLPGSSVHGIFQARIREWIAIPFSRVSSRLRDWTLVSCIAGKFFTNWTTREAQTTNYNLTLKDFLAHSFIPVEKIYTYIYYYYNGSLQEYS